MHPKNVIRVVGQGVAVTSVLSGIRRAREEGDSLRLAEAAVNALAVLLGVLIVIRTIRQEHYERHQEFPA